MNYFQHYSSKIILDNHLATHSPTGVRAHICVSNQSHCHQDEGTWLVKRFLWGEPLHLPNHRHAWRPRSATSNKASLHSSWRNSRAESVQDTGSTLPSLPGLPPPRPPHKTCCHLLRPWSSSVMNSPPTHRPDWPMPIPVWSTGRENGFSLLNGW